MSTSKVTVIATLWVALQALIPPALAQDAAATIEFVFGTAEIVSAAGDKRPIEKGSSIFVGDMVVTMDARTQLRFTDGSFVSLLPGSEFRVNAYTFNGTLDGNERLSMELLKGGLRTISGLVGKNIQSAYELITRVSTIGIRGTEYSVVYGENLSGSVAHGRIAVCNGAGCLDVAQGQSYFVRDENTRPELTYKSAQLPAPAPSEKKRKINERAKKDSSDNDTRAEKKDDSSEHANNREHEGKTHRAERLGDNKDETSDYSSRRRDSQKDNHQTSSAQSSEDLEAFKQLARGANGSGDIDDQRKAPEFPLGERDGSGRKNRIAEMAAFKLSGPTSRTMDQRIDPAMQSEAMPKGRRNRSGKKQN
jgi:hypothetical protein